MAVALVTPVLNDGDAVGNDILGMARALRAAGYEVRFYAEKARVNEDVYPLADLLTAHRSSLTALVYHHSIRCDAAVRAVEAATCPVAVKYHNVTPPRFFAGVNADAVKGAEVGRQQAARLAKTRAAVWVDSAFNGRELAADVPGARCDELPPFHQADALLAAAPDPDSVGGLDDWATTILCVGRVAPNKNLLLAVDAFAAYRERYDRRARLLVVGEHVFPHYSAAVAHRIREHDLDGHVVATGRVSTGQLKALYLSADALLVTSEHEGFCVPLVEAMGLGVPVVAVPQTAVPDTAGDAARYADADPAALAARLHEVVADGAARERQLLAGRRRYAERFTTPAIERRFRQLFDAL